MTSLDPTLTVIYAEACYMEAIGENLIGNLADDELTRVETQYLTLQRQANQQLRAMAAIEASKIKQDARPR